MADYQSVAPTTLALTLTEAKAHLNVSTDLDDDLITGYIKAATEALESRCSRAFVTQTRVLKMQTFEDKRYVSGRVLRPPFSPLKSVSSISYVASNGTTTTLPSSDYIVSTGDKPGMITESHGATWPATRNHTNDVTVTYVAGHSTVSTGVPERVKQAVRFMVGHLYRNREAVAIEPGVISIVVQEGLDAMLQAEVVETYA